MQKFKSYVGQFCTTHRQIAKGLAFAFVTALLATGGFAVHAAYADSATLGVTQITAVKTYATADDTYANGWEWIFDVTVPSNQTLLQMKFADWTNGTSVIPAANNIQFYSQQSTNASDEAHAIPITAADTYSGIMYINPNTDLNVNQAGRQIQIVVEARIPTGSTGGSYSTSYGINTTATSTISLSDLTQTYDSTAKSVTVTTDPSGLATQVTYNGSATAPTAAGTYTVDAVITDPNYTGTSTATLTINPAQVAVVANPQTKVYDGLTTTDPALTYTATPALFGSDTFTGALTRTAGEGVGSYPITQGTLKLDSNYVLNFSPSTFVITAQPAKVTLGNLNQEYGSTTPVTVTTDPSGLATSVTYNGSPTVPTNAGSYTVVAKITDPNYTGSSTETLVVAPRPITVTATTDDKIYDGTTAATSTPTITSGYLVGSDTATLTEAFQNKDAGTGKTLIPSATISDGNGGANYAVTLVNNTTGIITSAPATILATGVDKTYDGTTAATVNLKVLGAVPTDSLSATGDAVFDGSNVGPHTINVTNIVVSGTGVTSNDYSYNTSTSTTATINPASLTITADNESKTYGDTYTFNGTEFNATGLIKGTSDSVTSATLTSAGTVASAAFGTYPINISNVVGTGLSNYNISYNPGTLTVGTKTVTATITAESKQYDGTNTADITSCTVNGAVNGDNLTCTASNGTFSDKNVGNGKTVTADVTLVGTNAGNYTLTSPVTTTANITAAPLTVTAVTDNKIYDSTVAATGTPSITAGSLQGTDTATFSEVFKTKDVGSNKTLIPSISIDGGTGNSNYNITYVNDTTGVITARPLLVTAKGVDKVYDGTTDATVTLSDNRIAGDKLTDNYTTATFASPNVGNNIPITVTGISISGTDAGNYTLTDTSTTTAANITPAKLTILPYGVQKVYGDAITLPVLPPGFFSQGLQGTDKVTSVDLTSAGITSTAIVGKYDIFAKDAVISPSTSFANYDIQYATNTLTVTKAPLLGKILASNKTYDGTTDASTTCTFTGILNGDNVTCTTSNAAFATRNVSSTTVTADLNLSGPDAGNYGINPTATTNASINPLALTVTAVPNTKIYDGTTAAAALPTFTPTILGQGDTPDFIETYDTATAGINKTLTPSGVVNDGNNGKNYTYKYVSVSTGVISKANQTVSFVKYPSGTISGNSFTVSATSTSDLPVTFTGGTSGVCSVNADGTVNVLGSGQCNVIAEQAGNADYNPASTNMTFSVVYNVTPTTITISSVSPSAAATGSNVTINWTSTNAPTGSAVALTLFNSSGNEVGVLTKDADSTGSYVWSIPTCVSGPSGPGSGGIIPITSCTPTDSSGVYETPVGNYTIVAKLYTPKGGYGDGMIAPSPSLQTLATSAAMPFTVIPAPTTRIESSLSFAAPLMVSTSTSTPSTPPTPTSTPPTIDTTSTTTPTTAPTTTSTSTSTPTK